MSRRLLLASLPLALFILTPRLAWAQDNAVFLTQSVPATILTGQHADVSITVRNTGTTTWSLSGNYFLGSQNSENNLTWGLNRALLLRCMPTVSVGCTQRDRAGVVA